MLLSQDNKGSIPVFCTAHDVTLPLQRNNKSAIKKYPETDRFLEFRTHLMKNNKNSREKKKDWSRTRSSPDTLQVQNGGQLIWCNNNCIISMQGFVWVIFLKKATKALCYPSLLTMDGWLHFFSSKGLGKSQFTSILLTEARICLCNLRMYGHAPLLMGI